MLLKKKSEKILFFSIWALLMIGAGLWVFRPGSTHDETLIPPVLLGDELISWFRRASVTEMTSTTFSIEAKLQKKYAEQLNGENRTMHLAYYFMKDTTVLSQGVVEVNLHPDGIIKMVLPNPNRVSAKHILISLAH